MGGQISPDGPRETGLSQRPSSAAEKPGNTFDPMSLAVAAVMQSFSIVVFLLRDILRGK